MSLLYVSCIKNTEGGISANTIQQMGSRKLIPTKIIGEIYASLMIYT
jgi:hypothetical protein